jgi:hypothetical protein
MLTLIKTRKVIRNKDGNYIMKKRSTLQEDTIKLNTYVRNNRAPNYIHEAKTDRTVRRNR